MKIIEISPVVGSDTLCVSLLNKECFTLNEPIYEKFLNSKMIALKENIWQSTANNLVIPEGLVCDVRVASKFRKFITFHNIESGDELKEVLKNHMVCDIKVARKKDGYRYEWESES